MKKKWSLFFVHLFFFTSYCFSQSTDTLTLSVQDAENIFLKNNLSIIAAQYNIDASTALIKQAKLWDNPVLLTDQNLYDGRFLRHGKTVNGNASGEVYVQLQQLFRTAGKISKLTSIASANAKVSEWQYQLLLRNLRYGIHTDLYQVSQLLAANKIDNEELQQINTLYTGMQAQLKAGNISQKEFLRIQAIQTSLLQELTDLRMQLADVQNELHTLLQLQDQRFIVPAVANQPVIVSKYPLDSLLTLAKNTNPEYLLAQSTLVLQQQNLRYQQALRVPDVTVGAEYDKANSYVPNYYGLTIALPLPVFNRNTGNIASAGYMVKQQQTLVSASEQKLANDLASALQKLQALQELQAKTDTEFISKYNVLIENAMKAYQQRQLGLLEFVDLFETYKESQVHSLQQQYNLVKTKEDINLLVGANVFDEK